MKDNKNGSAGNEPDGVSRRSFLQVSRNAAVGSAVAATWPSLLWLNAAVAAIPAAGGYLLSDTRKCQGCMTCMLACSLVHEGKENLSLARIQVVQNSFARFPDDISLAQCRQCVEPACLEACPTEALHVSREHGNVRMIDVEKCVGCRRCVEACTFAPGRAIWDFEDEHAQKCDLCADTPFWNEKGGPDGKQACVELCPVAALQFTRTIPEQQGAAGYNVNLRGQGWKKLGFSGDPVEPGSEAATRARESAFPYMGRWGRPADLNPVKREGKE